MNTSYKQVLSMMAVGGLFLGFAAMALADFRTAQSQLKTASQEATQAALSENTDAIHWHLQRLVNCLVGPKGEAFDLDVGNPCEEQDGGAMQELQPAAGIQVLVDQALSLAKTGLMIEAVGPARDVAEAASKILIEASREVTEELGASD